MWQNRLQNQGHNNTQKRSLHDGEGINRTRGCNTCKHIAHNTGAPKYMKKIFVDFKGEINRHIVIIGNFDIPMISVDRSFRQKNQQGNSDLKWPTRLHGFKKKLLMFKYSCLPFPTTTFLCPTHPHLPPSIIPPLALSMGPLYIIDIYRTLHPKAAEYTFFSSAHGIFSNIGHKINLNKFKKTAIISTIFSDHNGTKQKISYNKKL